MNYKNQYVLAVIVGTLVFMLTLIQATDPDKLGLTPRMLAWFGIIAGTLGFAGQFLPNLRRPPTSVGKEPLPPDFIERAAERPNTPVRTLVVQRHSISYPEPDDDEDSPIQR